MFKRFWLLLFLLHLPLLSLSQTLELSGQNLRIGGGIHLDYLFFEPKESSFDYPGGKRDNDFLLKRARVKLWFSQSHTEEFIQFGLEPGLEKPVLDAELDLLLKPGLRLRFGQFKPPFSEERLESDLASDFIEKSLASNLSLSRSLGVSLKYFDQTTGICWEGGIFNGEDKWKNSPDSHPEIETRLSRSWVGENFTLKLGASYAWGKRLNQSSTPKSFKGKTTNEFVFFSPVEVNGIRERWEGDFKLYFRSFSVFGEYIHSWEEREKVNIDVDIDSDGVSDQQIVCHRSPLKEQGWSAGFTWLVTGEKKAKRVVPKSKWGALELVFRGHSIEFDGSSEGIALPGLASTGNEVNKTSQLLSRKSIDEKLVAYTLGMNWYLAPGLVLEADGIWQNFDQSFIRNGHHSDFNARIRISYWF